jgi:anti-sigma regulatory factor (Ser/Thr protein kinase)
MRQDDVIAPEPSPTGPVTAREHAFHHETLFYSGIDGFIDGTLPFIQDAVSAEEPILVAVDTIKIDLLTDALGDDAGRVGFTDMHALGRNPARIIPAWRSFLQSNAPDGRAVRGIGEPIWAGRSEAELAECQRHESLLNVAFDDGQAWRLLCPYDVAALDDELLAAAHSSHPFVVRDGIGSNSDGYVSARDGWSPFDGVLPAPDGEPMELAFTCDELGTLRASVAGFAADILRSHDRVDDLVLAANELATNSIYHGGGQGTLRMWSEDETLLCEVNDRGEFTEPLVGRVFPAPDEWSGRGLWLANQLCDLVQIRSRPNGSVVRLHMRSS